MSTSLKIVAAICLALVSLSSAAAEHTIKATFDAFAFERVNGRRTHPGIDDTLYIGGEPIIFDAGDTINVEVNLLPGQSLRITRPNEIALWLVSTNENWTDIQDYIFTSSSTATFYEPNGSIKRFVADSPSHGAGGQGVIFSRFGVFYDEPIADPPVFTFSGAIFSFFIETAEPGINYTGIHKPSINRIVPLLWGLDDVVVVSSVPEPQSWKIMIFGLSLGLLGVAVRRREAR